MTPDKIEIFWTDLVGFACPECKSRRVRQEHYNLQTPQWYVKYFCDKCGKPRLEFDARDYGRPVLNRPRHILLHGGGFSPKTSHWMALGMFELPEFALGYTNRQPLIKIVKK